MIGILDYGAGNIFSILNALRKNNIDSKIITKEADFKFCRKLIIPGVGAFSNAIEKLEKRNFINLIKEHHLKGYQILGICLGMQILFSEGKENGIYKKGLNFINGSVEKLKPNKFDNTRFRLPHIGWSKILINQKFKHLFHDEDSYFYFVHSYACISEDHKSEIIAKCKYGDDEFNCFVKKDNVYGIQFHPERSRSSGLNLLKKILE